MLTVRAIDETELHTELYRPADGGDCIRREDEERSRLQQTGERTTVTRTHGGQASEIIQITTHYK